MTRFRYLCLAGLGCAINALSGPLDSWDWLYPQPTGLDLYGLTYGADQFVAVGGSEAILRSSDGTNWTVVQAVPNGTKLNAVVWGNGRFVAVGMQGLMMRSSDASTWTRLTPFTNDLHSIVFGAGRFVAVGGNAATNWVLTSLDGVTWNPVLALPAVPTNAMPLTDITYGGGRFVAVGLRQILTSADGLIWEAPTNTPATYQLAAVNYGDNRYVAVGPFGLLYSTNATHWYPSSALLSVYNGDVAFGNGRHVVVGNGAAGLNAYSSDAINWTVLASQDRVVLTDAVFANGRFVGVGQNGAIATSTTGTNWVRVANGPTSYIASMAFGPEGCVVAEEYGEVRMTTNFVQWKDVPGGWRWHGLTYLGGRYLALQSAGYGIMHVSSNLSDWLTIVTDTTNGYFNVAYGGGRFVASGAKGTVAISSNALNWTVLNLPTTNDVGKIAYGNGRFVTLNRQGDVAISQDGRQWSLYPSRTVPGLSGGLLEFGNGLFLAIRSAPSRVLLRSTDGLTWSSTAFDTNSTWWSFSFANGLFLYASYTSQPRPPGEPSSERPYKPETYLLASRDGTNWIRHVVPFMDIPTACAAHGSKVVVGGFDGLLRQSGLFPTLSIRRGPPLELALVAAPGDYRVEASDSPDRNWQLLTNVSSPWKGTVSGVAPRRFYRATE